MALIPLVREEYPHAHAPAQRAQLCLLADLDQGIYLVVRRHVVIPDGDRDVMRDPRYALDSAAMLTLDGEADHGWERLHDGMDPDVALRAANQELRGFGSDGYRDRWGDPPAAIAIDQVRMAEIAAFDQLNAAEIAAPAGIDAALEIE